MSKNRKKLDKYITRSSINDITIKYGKETFNFNLVEELSINENKINEELKEQPSYYGFLLLLQSRLLTVKEDTQRQADSKYASKYLKASEKKNPNTGRNYSDKAAIQIALADEGYNLAVKRALQAKQDYNIITSCVRSFEQRAHLIQSLAANQRREQ